MPIPDTALLAPIAPLSRHPSGTGCRARPSEITVAELVARVTAAGDTLMIDDPRPDERGYVVQAARQSYDAVGRIVVGACLYPITLTEGSARTSHAPTKAELADAARYSWKQPPEYDYQPSGELTISLPSYWTPEQRGRRHTWSDQTRWRLAESSRTY